MMKMRRILTMTLICSLRCLEHLYQFHSKEARQYHQRRDRDVLCTPR